MTTNVKNNLNKNKMGNILILNVWKKLGRNVMLLNEKSYILMCSHAIIRLNKKMYIIFS